MAGRRINTDQLSKAIVGLGEAAIDPAVWPFVMDNICEAVGATGAVLLQSDVRTPDVPRTKSFEDPLQVYFKNNWHLSDSRAGGIPRVIGGEIVIDQDLLDPDQIRRDAMYNEVLFPFGYRWFSAVGFRAGVAPWILTLQRTGRDGPFDQADKSLLAPLAPRLTEVATLSTMFGRVTLSQTMDILAQLHQPALALDRLGNVINFNAAAEAGFDDEIQVRQRRLVVRDKVAAAKLAELTDLVRATAHDVALPADPIVIRRTKAPPVLVRVLPIDGPTSSVFVGARALLILVNLTPGPELEADLIARAFDVTLAEARVAALLATGMKVDAISGRLGVKLETVRSQLKSLFAKTGVHRQSELVSLLARLR